MAKKRTPKKPPGPPVPPPVITAETPLNEDEQRFWDQLVPKGDCLECLFIRPKWGGRHYRPVRLACALYFRKALTEDDVATNTCRNVQCCSPRHLLLLPRADLTRVAIAHRAEVRRQEIAAQSREPVRVGRDRLGDYVEMRLYRSERTTKVDPSVFNWIRMFRWTVGKSPYVSACIDGESVRLHRLVSGLRSASRKWEPDHLNGDKLDNRKANLRVGGRPENARNKNKLTGCSSRYRGVTYQRNARKWAAQLHVSGERCYLGLFFNEEDAARAYDRAAVARYGPSVRLNFPGETEVNKEVCLGQA